MKKIINVVFLSLLVVGLVTGCTKESSNDSNKEISNVNGDIKSYKDVKSKKGTLYCSRSANVEGGTGEFNYVIKYNNNTLLYLESTESVTISDSDYLKQFEDAYKTINQNYVGIKYYDATVTKNGNTITNKTTINYKKIDTKKLIELEGREDNIFDDNDKPKLDKWFDLAKKMGVSCSDNKA